MKTPDRTDCPSSVRLGKCAAPSSLGYFRAGRSPLRWMHHEPAAFLQLLDLVEVGALDVVLRPVPAQRAEETLDLVLLQPGGECLVVEALRRRHGCLEDLPGGIH